MESTSKVLVKKYMKGRRILQSPGIRSRKNIDFLENWLLENVPFFRNVKSSALKLILESVALEIYSPKEVVFEQEDYAQKFYVVLRGSLSAMVDTALLQRVCHTSCTPGQEVKRKLGHAQLDGFVKKERSTTVRNTHSKEMWQLSKGDYFGEHALLVRKGRLLYTVCCIENTELITIGAGHFDEALKSHFQEIIFNRAQMLAGMELFQNCAPDVILILALLLRENQYKFGECMYRQNMACDSLKVIGQGSVKISTDSGASPPRELEEKIQPPKDYLSEILMEVSPPKKDKIKQRYSYGDLQGQPTLFSAAPSGTTPPSQYTKNCLQPNSLEVMGFVLHQPKPRGNNVYICSLGPGDMLCDIEAICKLNRHLFSAVCTSNVIVYELKYSLFKSVLNKGLSKFTYQVIDRVTQQVKLWHSKHTSIPFFDTLVEVMDQMEKEFEAEGVHKMVGKIQQNSRHRILAIRKMMDLPVSGGSREDDHLTLQFPAIINSSIKEFSDGHSSMQPLEVFVFPEKLHLGADSYQPRLNKTSAMNSRKKNPIYLDTTVSFGKTSCIDGPSKPNSIPNALPLSKTSVTEQIQNLSMPSHLSSTSHEENQGELHLGVSGNNISDQNIACAVTLLANGMNRKHLAQIRYQVLYNKNLSQRKNDLYGEKKYPDINKEAIRQLHMLTPEPDFDSRELIHELEKSKASRESDDHVELVTNSSLIGANNEEVAGDIHSINMPRNSNKSQSMGNKEPMRRTNVEQKGKTDEEEKRKLHPSNSTLLIQRLVGRSPNSARYINTVVLEMEMYTPTSSMSLFAPERKRRLLKNMAPNKSEEKKKEPPTVVIPQPWATFPQKSAAWKKLLPLI